MTQRNKKGCQSRHLFLFPQSPILFQPFLTAAVKPTAVIEMDDVVEDADVIPDKIMVVAVFIEPRSSIVGLVWHPVAKSKHLITIEIADAVLSHQRGVQIADKWQDSRNGDIIAALLVVHKTTPDTRGIKERCNVFLYKYVAIHQQEAIWKEVKAGVNGTAVPCRAEIAAIVLLTVRI